MSTVNIQTLFARLRLEHFQVYLPAKGWYDAPEAVAGRVRFELPETDATYVLLLPSSNNAPQSRRLMQTAVYNLSGVEDRQPMEIVTDLLAVNTSAAGAGPTGAPRPLRVRLRNLHSAELTLQVASRSADNSLMPGEAIEILYHAGDAEVVEIDFHGSKIHIDDRAGG